MASRTRPIDSALGSQVRLARIERRLSQAILAAQLGVSIYRLQAYETGRARLGASCLIKVAKALGKDIGFFISGRPARLREGADETLDAPCCDPDPPGSPDPDHSLNIIQLMACIEHERPDYKERLYDLMMSISERAPRRDHSKTGPVIPLPHVKPSALD